MATVTELLNQIADVGRDRERGGYSRPVYSGAELDLRSWFVDAAQRQGLDVEIDRNGVIWAWAGSPGGTAPAENVAGENTAGGEASVHNGALVTGSHLDSVPGGGAFDGPLGVASALVAVQKLRERGVEPGKDSRPLAITVFPEEEGSRFGVACLGSRLMTGQIAVEKALNLKDSDGNSFGEVARAHGLNPEAMGADAQGLARIGQFIELHVEQGRGLIDLPSVGVEGFGQSAPVAIGGSVLGHGRWKISVSGEGNHAGTTLMADRADPMVAAAKIVLAVQEVAMAQADARATVGRIQPVPGGTNVIASRVDLWLVVRHPDDSVTAALVEKIHGKAQIAAAHQGCSIVLTQESLSPTVTFDSGLTTQLSGLLPGAPVLDTGAGHDAGILAGHVPSAMLFIRNPTGISHSPEEFVESEDADHGAEALADVLQGLL